MLPCTRPRAPKPHRLYPGEQPPPRPHPSGRTGYDAERSRRRCHRHQHRLFPRAHRKLPLFIAIVVILGFLLLTAVFRSLLVPFVASVMNLLSIGAALGAMNAVFNWGWGRSILGLTGTGPVDVFIPVLMFSVLFGLSMDYEVYLMSRIQEEWRRRLHTERAIASGLKTRAVVRNHQAITIGHGREWPSHRRRRRHHDHGLRVVHPRWAAGPSRVRVWSRVLGPGRRLRDPQPVGAGHSPFHRPRELVYARWLDRIVPNLSVEAEDLAQLPTEENPARSWCTSASKPRTGRRRRLCLSRGAICKARSRWPSKAWPGLWPDMPPLLALRTTRRVSCSRSAAIRPALAGNCPEQRGVGWSCGTTPVFAHKPLNPASWKRATGARVVSHPSNGDVLVGPGHELERFCARHKFASADGLARPASPGSLVDRTLAKTDYWDYPAIGEMPAAPEPPEGTALLANVDDSGRNGRSASVDH